MRCRPLLHALPLLLAACAQSPQLVRWEAEFYATEHLYLDGGQTEAAARYAELRHTATDPRDADDAALMACETPSRHGQFLQAAVCYDALAIDAETRATRARALLHAAELRLDELGRTPDAVRMLETLVTRAPEEAASARAVDVLVRYARRGPVQRDEMIQRFRELEVAAPDSDLADNLLLRAAELMAETDRPRARESALALLQRLQDRHGQDPTAMDALMLQARLQRALARPRNETRTLEQVVATWETSLVFGTYTTTAHLDATRRLVELYRYELKDLERAERHMRELPKMMMHATELPALLVTLAEIQEERGHLGDALSTYREVLSVVEARRREEVANDRRICSEEPDPTARDRCFADIATLTPIEPRETAVARQAIARLQHSEAPR
jgi:tetratricopeptide (TPR) repeat protein